MNRLRHLFCFALVAGLLAGRADAAETHHVRALKITVLSTMLADAGIGEWGYAALVEVDGKRFLFDTGARPETVLANAREMQIDLANIEDVILSHNHGDHTGGLTTLRRELQKQNPKALSRAHVGEGIFSLRTTPDGRESMASRRSRLNTRRWAVVSSFMRNPKSLRPGVWFPGPVPRKHPEELSAGLKLKSEAGDVEDTIPEDSSLVIAATEGLVILTGCGHAGIINTVDYARDAIRPAPLLAVVGGLHTYAASDEALAWTGEKLKAAGLRYLLAGHCTGIEAAFRLRTLAGLDRKTAVVSAVGSSYTLGVGIDPRAVAR